MKIRYKIAALGSLAAVAGAAACWKWRIRMPLKEFTRYALYMAVMDHEKGKSATSKSYMWLYRTSGNAEAPIVLYDYQPNRKAENAEQFLEGFSGWLHADGYQGYHRLRSKIRVVGCWAHARRKFDEALTAVPKEQQSASKPAETLCYFAKLFQLEQDFAALTVEERFDKRLEQEKPVLEALLA